MLFVPRQVALAAAQARAAAAMAKEVSKKERKAKSKAAAKGSVTAAGATATDARAVVVASVAAFLESGGFPRTLAALQSEANLEDGSWRSSRVSLEELIAKFLESSDPAPVTVGLGSNEQDKTDDGVVKEAGKDKIVDIESNDAENNMSQVNAVQEDGNVDKQKKKKKASVESCVPESKASESSAQERPSENAGDEAKEKKQKKKKKDASSTGSAVNDETNGMAKSDDHDQKLDGNKKKSKKQEEDGDVEARLEKVELAIKNKFEEVGKVKDGAHELREEEQKNQNHEGEKNDLDKVKKKKKGKSAPAPVEAEGEAVEPAKDDNDKKAKKKRKKSHSEENVQADTKEVEVKGSVPKPDDDNKSGMDIQEDENGRPSSEDAVVGKKRKLEEVEGSNPAAKENSTVNQTPCNGFIKDNSMENSTVSKPSKRQKLTSEPKTVNAFQRVKLENVKFADERLQDNSYWAKGGAESGYGAKAQEILGQVKGRGFRHEKTKKKRGTYRGGQIDLQSHSIKFDNSDDE